MKLSDVVNQLRAVLPKYTELFGSTLSVSAITVTGGVANIETLTAHGLSSGANVTLSDVVVQTAIASVTQSGLVFTFVTSTDHDLTLGWPEHATVLLSGFTEGAWNDSFTLVDVPNRRTFKVRSTNTLPTLNGGEVLNEVRADGVNGRWSAVVIDTTNFQISPITLDGTYSGGTVATGQRISGVIDEERAIEQYTAQEESAFWMFVTPTDAEVSKDRSTYSDALATRVNGEDMRLRLLDGFNLYIIKNTRADIGAVAALDACRHTLLLPILKAVNGVRFDSGLSGETDFKSVLAGHAVFDYNRAILVYQYSFQVVYDLTGDDTVQPEDTRAFRDIDLTEEIGGDDTTALTVGVNLDEEPLT